MGVAARVIDSEAVLGVWWCGTIFVLIWIRDLNLALGESSRHLWGRLILISLKLVVALDEHVLR